MREEFTVVPALRGGWPAVAGALARLLDRLLARRRDDEPQYVIVDGTDGVYTQVALAPDGSVHAEAVSNRFLGAGPPLGAEEIKALHALGWSDPTVDEVDQSGTPNHWRTWSAGVSMLEVATALVLPLFEVYGVSPSAVVTLTTFAGRAGRTV